MVRPYTTVCLSIAISAGRAFAQGDPPGMEFVTVGAANNPAYDGPDPFGLVAGRGSVSYEYRIGQTEVPTSVWLEFFNAALARPDPLPFANAGWWGVPIRWGATVDTSYTGPGMRYRLRTDAPNAGMLPAGGISWREAAVLCNFLCHERDPGQASFLTGAYDVSTFGGNFPTFTDQREHTPGARFWVPTLDEWMKAVHYDPNGNGPGQHRWWLQPNGTDTPLVFGPPPNFGGDGTGQANSGFALPNNGQYNIPLGSYPTVQSPWGLVDAAGATHEWLETTRTVDNVTTRGADGSYWTDQNLGADWVYSWGQDSPSTRSPNLGFRIASSIPAPSSALSFLILCGMCVRSRGRKAGRLHRELSGRTHTPSIQRAIFALVTIAVGGAAWAQPGPDGYDWAQIGAVGNSPYTGFSDPISPTYGRAGVGYSYSLSRTEVTTEQWVSFFNAALARPDPLPFAGAGWWNVPVLWGATRDTAYTGPGVRYRLRTDIANAGMVPASGVSWRTCAVLCNWLNAGRNGGASGFMDGAYDVTTFTGGFPTFGDQRQHTPGAHYWIPTLDEYMKGAFYDPNGNGPGGERWWQYPDRSDSPLIYGPPPTFGGDGSAQANAGFRLPNNLENQIPLGAYPSVQSPWGLLDLAGGTGEWLEDFWLSSDGRNYRLVDGSTRGNDLGDIDILTAYGQLSPGVPDPDFGLRLASDVPTPGVGCSLIAASCVVLGRRQRRRS